MFSHLKKISQFFYKLPILIILFVNSPCYSKNFESQFNFRFNLPDGYEIFNKNNLYDIYNHSNKNPLVKNQINLAKKRLENQKVELLYNFTSHSLNNINILVFDADYNVTKKNVLKQCKKILKIEKKIGKRKVDLKECRMHDQPLFAEWSMYRENDSSFMKGATTQQIIFLFKKKEFVITSTCWEKCNVTKKDIFKLIKSIKF
jgi:hypothetical protein